MKTKLTLSIILFSLFFSFEKGRAQAPSWQWAKSAGGTFDDVGHSISTDASGNVLVTGFFQSPSITLGTTTLTNAGVNYIDIFVVKYDASGNVFWAKSAGGTSSDWGAGISTDASGNVLVTGYFGSPSITFGTTTLTNAGTNDMFIVKYDASGNVLWAKSEGGTSYDYGYGISTDASGNVLVTGYFGSPSITFGTTTLTNAGDADIFIVKYDASGNVLWAKSVGGTSAEDGFSISTDASENVLVTGYFASASITFGTTTLTNAGFSDIFVVKYDASGNVLWAKSAGGTSNDNGAGISTDASGEVLVTGYFGSSSITFGTTTLTNAGFSDIFVVKYDASGNVLWAKSAGGTFYDPGVGISTDPSGNVLVTGFFESPSITFGTTTLTNVSAVGYSDIFVAKLDGTTGIAEQTPNNGATIYPNPANDYITIKTNSNKKQVITITDITGKIIYTTTILSEKTIINTKDFSQGVYAVQVQAGDAVETRKVIVVR